MDSTQSTESPKPIITVEIRTHGTTKPEIKDEFNNQVDTYFWKKNLEEIQNQTAIGKIEKRSKYLEMSRNVQIKKGVKSPNRKGK